MLLTRRVLSQSLRRTSPLSRQRTLANLIHAQPHPHSEIEQPPSSSLSPHLSPPSALELPSTPPADPPYEANDSNSSDGGSSNGGGGGSIPAVDVPDPKYPPTRVINPFNTHAFVKKLEKDFSPQIAHALMRSTRALLSDRITRTKREGLDQMESENEAYLYRAALSELRTELTMRTRNESASLQTTTGVIKRDVESLSSKMKEDIATLKHEIQMELNNRKNEVNSEHKMSAIATEELNHRAIVRISDLRTEIEQAKWDNTRRGVVVIGVFVAFVIAALELAPKPKPKPPQSPPPVPLPQLDLREFEESTETSA